MQSSTLVLCIPADGVALDSTLIWPQTTIPPEFHSFPVKHIRCFTQKTAYQTRQSFSAMMHDYYIPEMIRRRSVLGLKHTPILILLDGHTSRISLTVIEECVSLNIILLILPSHTSHLTQPLDCSPNGVLKNVLSVTSSQAVNQPSVTMQNPNPTITPITNPDTSPTSEDEEDSISDVNDDEADEEKVPPLPDDFFVTPGKESFLDTAANQRHLLAYALPLAVEKATSYKTLTDGWRKAGLHPYNPTIVFEQVHPDGPLIETRRNSLSISGKILTARSTRISVWTWKIQQLHKELSNKRTTDSHKAEIKEQIQKLQAQLDELITEEEQENKHSKASSEKEAPRESEQSIEKEAPRESEQSIENKIAHDSDSENGALNSKNDRPPTRVRFIYCFEKLMEIPTKKRIRSEELEYDALDGLNYLGVEDKPVHIRERLRRTRGQKHMPQDMMSW